MCNLYSVTKGRAAIIALTRALSGGVLSFREDPGVCFHRLRLQAALIIELTVNRGPSVVDAHHPAQKGMR